MLDVPEVSAKIAQAKEQLQQQLHKHKWQKWRNCRPTSSVKSQTKGLAEQYEYAQNLLKERKTCTKTVCFLHKIMMRLSQNYKVQKAQYDAVNAELHDVEIGTRLEKK